RMDQDYWQYFLQLDLSRLVGAYCIRPPHTFEPGWGSTPPRFRSGYNRNEDEGSTVIERSGDAAHPPDRPRLLAVLPSAKFIQVCTGISRTLADITSYDLQPNSTP